GGIASRLTSGGKDAFGPRWSHDGKRMAYTTGTELVERPSNGAGAETLLLRSQDPKMPLDWSPDDRFILYQETRPKTGSDLWLLSTSDGQPRPNTFLQTAFRDEGGRFSPDGRWIAYASNAAQPTGPMEVYVRPFPTGDRTWRISTTGGGAPEWRRDG